jgi:hypothetical protein
MSRSIAAALVAALAVSFGRSASAADVVWNVAGPADWNTASNWSPARVPTGTDNAKLNNGGTATVTGSAPTFTALFVSSGALGTGIVNVNSGGALNVSADVVNNESVVVGNGGTSTAQLNVSGTGLLTEAGAGNFYVGSASPGIVNQTGGTVNLFTNQSANSWLRIGAGANGTYTLSSGSLTTTNASNDLVLGNTGVTGTFNLNGGTATIGGAIYSFGPSIFNFNGGTLRPNANQSSMDQTSFMSGLTTANVRNGGAIIDTNGFNITITQPLVHSTVPGDNAIDGGLTKNGLGTLTLSGASTYNGPTYINNGTVLVPSGGSLSGGGSLFIGTSIVAGQNGTLTVDGTGMVSETDPLNGIIVGSFGSGRTGTLNIGTTVNGASLTTAGLEIAPTGAVNVGAGAVTGTLISNGNVDISGVLQTANLDSTFSLAPGQQMIVEGAGARASFTGNYTTTSNGNYLIRDSGAKMETLAGGLLTVASGATVSVELSGILSSSGGLIVGTTTNGTITVDGANSKLTVAGSTSIASGGSVGQITFQNGSSGSTFGADVNLAFSIANNTNGNISVLSGSTITALGNLYLLDPNPDIVNGLTPSGQSATFTVDGTGSTVTLNPGANVSVGQYIVNSIVNPATLTVSNNGIFTVGTGGTTALNPSGTININGGIVDLKTLNNNGGTLNFNSGSLSFIGSFNVGVVGLLGQSLTLDPSKSLTLTGTTTIDQFKTLTLSGGTLSTGNLVNNGTFNFTSGTLDITGAGGLTIGSGGALGSSFTLGAGSNLNVAGPTIWSSSTATLTVNGGTFSTNSNLQSFGSITTNGSFTVAQQVFNYSGATLDVTGGSFTAGYFDNFGSLVLDAGTMTINSGALTNNSGAYFYIGPNKTAVLNSASTNAGEIQLGGASALLTGPGSLANTGLIHGDGVIANAVTNNAGGEIRAESGRRIKLSGANGPDAGNINLQGGTAEFSQPLTIASTGQINSQGNLIVPVGSNTGIGANQSSVFGLADNGAIQFSGGNTNIYGSVNLPGVTNMLGTITGPGTGKLLIGAGANTVSFYGDVWNNGNLFRTATGSYAVFFGTVHGASSFSGGGTVDFEGTHQVGNSPAVIGIGGNAIYGVASALDINLGGTTPGNGANNYAQVNVAAGANLSGTLNLIPYNGFVPVSGDKFTVMTYASESGTFSSLTGTSPAPGLTYSAVYLPTSLVILTTTSGDKTWGVDASGNASVGSNWLGGVAPGGIGDSAAFTTIITANRTVTLDADTTVGTLKFDSPNNYLIAGPHTLTLQAAGSTAAAINVSGAHGNGAQTIAAPITLASGLNVTQNSGGVFTISGPLNNVAGHNSISVSGSGVTAITGSVNLGNATALSVGGTATLRFGLTSGAASVGSGVTATVTKSATLELAGSVSALSSGTNRVNIANNSNAAVGVLVSGTNQQVGGIDGPGNVQVNAGASLTANHITAGALVIGGTAGSPALATIDASDSSGNPLGQSSDFVLAGSLTPSVPFNDGVISTANLSSVAARDTDPMPLSAGNSGVIGNASPVPEASTLALALLAVLGVISTQFVRKHFRCQTV